ncbi:MAG: D-alanyl-D-alanine carboxypeptidase [Defluviitaleaceae bacterium]|nr:D-alanyl-D-alanine carboxypeptidase [Defluviitaleaceae bacterium]MCL2273795.1 D-alanyl-D-alanine carboxypeptidase [Defluviitaleaceae bacterium]
MFKFIFATTAIILFFSTQGALQVRAEEVPKPTVNAHGAILLDAETGRVLWGKQEHSPLAMASTTKIMTAIITLESGRMDETVTVSSKAAAAPKVKMNLTAGEKIRLGDLMLALMLESSNDAAVAIAEHLHGSVAEFCAVMTEKAREIGAKDTLFETASGLDSNNDNHSTPYDLAIITRYALEVDGFLALTNTRSANFSSNKRSYSFNNRNRLLNEYAGANGVKTGFTNKAGHCFVGAAKRKIDGEDMQLISVVLASGWGQKGKSQKYIDSKEILNYGFNNYTYETIITAENTAGSVPVTRSRTVEIPYAYAEGLRVPLNAQEKTAIAVEVLVPSNIKAPIQAGDMLGTADVYIGENLYAKIPLFAVENADRHDFKTSLEKVINALFSQLTAYPVDIALPDFTTE